MQIKSPITNSSNVIFEDNLISQTIIDAYMKDYGVNVSKYFEGLEFVKIYKCLDTGYRFYFPLELSGDSKLYEKLQKRAGYYRLKPEHQAAKNFIKANTSVLEIGCGSGLFLEELQNLGMSCQGLEFNDDAVSAGLDKGLKILKEDICKYANDNQEKYDVVCSFQVLEHIYYVHDFINASLAVLKKGGKFIVGVPNNNPFLYKYDKYHTLNLPPHHLGLWNKNSLELLQKFFPIKLEKLIIEQLHEQEYDHYFKIQSQHLKSQSKLIGVIIEAVFINLRPARLRRKLQKLVNLSAQGRNVLAVYTKL
ncbi:methyltransferase domain-containing protein [Hassallia byssoidea VB512170]|uniref:Methyltransferase domain-containing protein n=1 Tax=Hassallia byssoidea VB512170 TaxID=1304833 RepID=A0A846HHE0_9CYAN|nr:class I SAM-dependent methyltransferase [Hassalia byssoidea]NEU76752.1 methyltransferase domain-containing protein [Hassalia byssoidea VB512170]